MTTFLLAVLLACNLDAPPAFDARVYENWAAADVDGDGELDLVAAAANEVTVAYGTTGDGFELPRVVAGIAGANALLAEDMDGDGRADILVLKADAPRGTVLLRNRGGRTFAVPEPVLPETLSVLTADVDGDGDLDLAGPLPEGAIVTALNDGRGNFTAGPRSPMGVFGAILRPGDFNGDGALDVITISNGNAYVLRGNGTGLFTLLQTVELPRDAFFIATGDLNGDRYTDAIVPDRQSSRIQIRLGTAAGLDAPMAYAVPPAPYHAKLTDLDADGDNDVLVFSDGGATGGAAFFNDGRANLTKGPELPGTIAGMGTLLGDTNRDGILDLIAGAGGRHGTVAVVRGLGGGRFDAPERILFSGERFARLVDIDGNGADDLLTIDRNPTILTIAYDDGRSEELAIPEGGGAFPIEATNAPGLELVVGERDRLVVYERRNGRWDAVLTIAGTGIPRDVVAADARHLAVTWLQDRGAAIETYVLALPDVPRWRAELPVSLFDSILARDFTGDGVNDLLVTGSGTWPGIPHDFTPLRNGYLSLFPGRGDGTFGDERRILSNESFLPADAGDFDGDSDPDIVIGMQRGGDVVVLRNDGRGGFGTPEVIEEETERNIVRYAAGDLNGDGVDDLVTSIGNITLTLRLGTRDGFVVRPQVLGRGHTPRIARGKLSLLGFNTLTTIGLTCDGGRRRATGR